MRFVNHVYVGQLESGAVRNTTELDIYSPQFDMSARNVNLSLIAVGI